VKSRVLGIIPARLASTRLPRKPLFPLLGRPLVEWVWRRVQGMDVLDTVVVATDSPEVAKVCRAFGAKVEMTSESHPSGTDRVAEVARREAYAAYPLVVNIQGDEPLLNPVHLEAVVDLLESGRWDVATCASPLLDLEARGNPSVVKVVRAPTGRALYFSRAQIPYKRDSPPTAQDLASDRFLAHVGIYGYTREGLERWVALDPSPLEELERLEQLRPLEAGMDIGVAVVEGAEAGVDTPADVVHMERRLTELGYEPLTGKPQ
jgi:3-deoxy-manno-octulosonate cytidylyltransferase (CMP-KDO synthetase)